MAIGVIVLNEDFENLKMLPKIKQCSKLMQRIYDEVCEAESSMCFIENGDEEVSKDDIKILQDEVRKYGICDDIVFGEDDCLVIGYSNIETDFIDDRGL